MNAAIDQQCEKYIRANGLEKALVAKRAQKIDTTTARPCRGPRYQGELPEGNDGLGLLLLGMTGDEVLPDAETYAKIKAEDPGHGARHRAGRHPEGRPGAEHLHLQHRVRPAHDGRHAGVFHRPQGAQLLLGVDFSGYHIAEAGANPISQLAFTLANGFTFVEYYLSRGMRSTTSRPTCRSSSPTAWTPSTP
jgi:methylmalonyl-CoA mutase